MGEQTRVDRADAAVPCDSCQTCAGVTTASDMCRRDDSISQQLIHYGYSPAHGFVVKQPPRAYLEWLQCPSVRRVAKCTRENL